MMEIHGWADISIDLDGEQESSDLDEVVASTQSLISDLDMSQGVEIIGVGGSYILRVTLVQNRDRGDRECVLKVLQHLGEVAPATYGIFFHRDDDLSNSFKQFVIRRGVVDIRDDELFSPAVPNIENA